ncbi:type VI secretion system protein TssA [Pseudomonas baltica]|uniref:type VI secretion system protein TssA n=1 Tax=Pseudomonas baltica TaxID=2762576 RepID=UPI002896A238|nr:type VI secretion system protein TssA [Pseudomonas baltica]
MTFSGRLCTHYLALAKVPISSDSFGGEEVRYSSEYEALETELSKASSLHASSRIDWLKILEGSESILRTQSKDLRVATWLIWALHQRESFVGLLAGLGMLRALFEQHWVDLHPVKSRTRAGAMVWLVPRLDQALSEDIAVKEQLPLFQALVEHLDALDVVLAQQLGEDAPLILPIRRRLSSMIKRAADNLPEPGSVGAVVAQVKQVATQLVSPGSPLQNDKDAQKALRAQQDGARPLCTWWLRQKATDIRALRLNRTLMWLGIDALPQRNAEHITDLRGLPADKLTNYRERFDAGSYADLLIDLEASLAKAPFWLDGQRIVWECLQGLHAETSMREVEIHLSLLLQRLPGIAELRFHDGQPFADPATRSWISAQVMPHLQPASAPQPVSDSGEQPRWEQALLEVQPILRKDGLKPAVQILKQQMRNARGGREQFFWHFCLARLCHQAKKYDLARTQLETLDSQLQSSGLDIWEPELALNVLQLLHGCIELLPPNHAARERKDEIYRRLCHLDLEVVLE